MYAWDVAVAQHKATIHMDTQDSPGSILIVQLPHDVTLGNASMAHYTWGTIFKEGNKDGKEVSVDVWQGDECGSGKMVACYCYCYCSPSPPLPLPGCPPQLPLPLTPLPPLFVP